MQIIDAEKPYRLVKARHGWFLANREDLYVARQLLTYGEYGEREWELLEKLMRPGMDAVEVGANIGALTVPMARKLVGLGRRLLAVEPQPVVFQNLCANLALNGLFNVVAENTACGDRAGSLSFDVPDYAREHNFGGIEMREDGLGGQRVRATPLDDLVPDAFEPGMIKIDVEGFEQKVLEGARRIIARHRPLIYLENDRADRSKSLIEWLWAVGYKICWHTPHWFNPENFAGNGENIYPDIASFNMLALPGEAPIAVTGFVPIEDSGTHPFDRLPPRKRGAEFEIGES